MRLVSRGLAVVACCALVQLAGCGPRAVDCTEQAAIVAQVGDSALSCEQVAYVETWVELLSGRSLRPAVSDDLQKAVARSFLANPTDTLARVEKMRLGAGDLRIQTGPQAAATRGHALYSETRDGSILPNEEARGILSASAKLWTVHEADGLALAEADIEGWLSYASLCHEVQGGRPLRVSVGDRVALYAGVKERFDEGNAEERLALVSIGVFWFGVRERWKAAPYELQQEWIKAAPLPPPMTATTLGYLDTIVQGDVVAHSRELHGVLGPLRIHAP